MRKPAWFLLLFFCAIATLADGFTSAVTLMAIIQPSNVLGQVIVVVGGFIITGYGVGTRVIFTEGTPFVLKGAWVIAVLVDVFTTVVGTIYYVIMDAPLNAPVDFSSMSHAPMNPGLWFLAFSLTAIITGSSLASLYVFERAL